MLRDYCDALSKLPEEDVLKNREATYHSMKNIFHHIVKVHDGWLNVSAQDDSPDHQGLRQGLRRSPDDGEGAGVHGEG